MTAPNVQFVQGDAARFRADEPYDRVISIRVLEYIPEWATIVGRLGDLVRPGGRAVLITKTPISVWRGTGRERWFVAGPRRLARRIIKGPRQHDFWQRYIGVGAMIRAMRDAGFVDIDVRPVIWGLPVYARGTMQYPIVPAFAEPAMLRLTESLWLWTLGRGAAVRRLFCF